MPQDQEERIAYLEGQLAELNELVLTQQRMIISFNAGLARMQGKIDAQRDVISQLVENQTAQGQQITACINNLEAVLGMNDWVWVVEQIKLASLGRNLQ